MFANKLLIASIIGIVAVAVAVVVVILVAFDDPDPGEVALTANQSQTPADVSGSIEPGEKISPRIRRRPLVSAADLGIFPDPDFADEISKSSVWTTGWNTDFSLHSVPYSEIGSAVPRDGIPAIDDPKFILPHEVPVWEIDDREPVISFELNGVAKAYPLNIMTWHEIVNDTVGGVPVAVTFCPLCNSAIVLERTLGDTIYDFGVSGNLRHNDLIMYDRQTHSWWQQFTAEAIVGELVGNKLGVLPASIVSFADFKDAHPDGQVLSRRTGFNKDYGSNPYAGYDRADRPPVVWKGVTASEADGRLLPKDRVVAVTIGDEDVAFPYSVLEIERVVNYTINDQALVVFFKFGTASALDRVSISASKDVGSTGVFDPVVDGEKLTFSFDGENIVDDRTGSVWNQFGTAVIGPLSGTRLERILHADHFWFALAAFKPNTKIYQGGG